MNRYWKTFITATLFVIVLNSCSPSINSTNSASQIETQASNLSRLKTDCIKYLDNPPTDKKVNGSIILTSLKRDYLLNLETSIQKNLGSSVYNTVSFDGNKIAYIDIVRRLLIIVNSNWEILKTIPEPDEGYYPIKWLDQNNLAVEKHWLDNNGSFRASLVILNTFTEEKRELLPEYPDMRFNPHEVNWIPSLLIPDNKLEYLVYPVNMNSGFVLWNLLTNEEVTHFNWIDYVSSPEWSPTGNEFITSMPIKETNSSITTTNFDDGLPYVEGNDLFSINQSGNLNRLTFLTTAYYAKERGYRWSPDGKKIAFWLYIDNTPPPQLAYLDLLTRNVTNLCITSGTESGAWSELYWSPDGNRLVFTREADDRLTVIVDFEDKIAFPVAKDDFVNGWIRNTP